MGKALEKLRGGDLRSIGKSDELVSDILETPELFDEVFNGIFHADPIVRARAADAIEKASRAHPEYLKPHRKTLIEDATKIEQQEIRWHVAQMLPRLELSGKELDGVVQLLHSWMKSSKSKIVIVNSMQALADLAERDGALRMRVGRMLRLAANSESPAIASRARKLMAQHRYCQYR